MTSSLARKRSRICMPRSKPAADHRLRGGHRHIGQVRAGGGGGADLIHHLQQRSVPDGWARLACRSAALWRCQRHCRGGWRLRCCLLSRRRRSRPASADRPVPPECPSSSSSSRKWASPACQNFPNRWALRRQLRANLEATGMGYDKEVEMVRLAHEMDLLTTRTRSRRTRPAPCPGRRDILVAHVGLTTGGTIGAGVALSLDEAIGKVMEMAQAGAQSPSRPDRYLSRRAVRRAGGGRQGASPHARDRRVLRRNQHRAPADRARHHRPGERLQGLKLA